MHINIEDDDLGLRLAEIIKKHLKYSSRSIRKMYYTLNGKKISYKRKVYDKGILRIHQTEDEDSILPIKMPLDIRYEDNNILVINKPKNLLVHPTRKKVDKTLLNGIKYYFLENNIQNKVRLYNRLDMDTTGLVVAVKSAYVQNLLQSKETIIVKKYLALVENSFKDNEKEFLIDKPIESQKDRIDRKVSINGKESITRVKILKNYVKYNIALLECELLTGRTHQIRVHLNSIKHPILGDSLYNKESKFKNINRQLLHSYYIKISNNILGNIEIKADMPNDMLDILKIEEAQ